MRNNRILIRNVYNVDGQVFNVGEDGTMTRFDAITKKSHAYASGDNVKHCIVDAFTELSGIKKPIRSFIKDISKNEKDKQSSIYTEFDLTKPHIRLFGVWNSFDKEDFNAGKYNKCSLKSIINISPMYPLHPLLVSTERQCGVNSGNSNDKVCFQNNKEIYCTIEELKDKGGKTLEDAEKLFNETRAMNFYSKNKTSSGIYYIDFNIDVEQIRCVNINGLTLSDEEKNKYIELGYRFITDELRGINYFVIPLEEAIKDFNYLVESLFEWDFLSNTSVHGNIKELLRTTISEGKANLFQEATMATLTPDGTSATLDFFSKEEEEELGIFSYNSKLLKKFYNKDDIEYININAKEKAIEKIKELGKKILENMEI